VLFKRACKGRDKILKLQQMRLLVVSHFEFLPKYIGNSPKANVKASFGRFVVVLLVCAVSFGCANLQLPAKRIEHRPGILYDLEKKRSDTAQRSYDLPGGGRIVIFAKDSLLMNAWLSHVRLKK
jgi:hypothetical protein